MEFILFIIILLCSLILIMTANAVTSVLYLIVIFLLSSIMLLLLGAEFLSLIIIIIYIGAISILFLFVIMMLNLRIVEVYNTLLWQFPIGIFLGLLFFILYMFIIIGDDIIIFFSLYKINDKLDLEYMNMDLIFGSNNLYLLADLLFNEYYIFIIESSFILLLSMVGVIILTKNDITENKNIIKIIEKNSPYRREKNKISIWMDLKYKKKI